MRRALALACAASLAAGPAAAQLSRWAAADVGAGAARFNVSGTAGTRLTLSGVALGGSGSVFLGPVVLQGSYLQGRLAPDTGAALERDLVEAALFVAVRPVRWLAIGGGPRLRGYITSAATQRWVLGEARVRAEGALLTPILHTHLTFWRALSADVNTGQEAESAQGGEAGLTVRLRQAPYWGRLTYAFDRLATAGGARVETLEQITVSVGFGGR